jgi:hypothetical protein
MQVCDVFLCCGGLIILYPPPPPPYVYKHSFDAIFLGKSVTLPKESREPRLAGSEGQDFFVYKYRYQRYNFVLKAEGRLG